MATIQITGKTFDCRDLIRSAGGVWQPATKTWAIDAEKWAALVARKPILTSGCRIAGQTESAAPEGRATRLTAICRQCKSYCYGDCASN